MKVSVCMRTVSVCLVCLLLMGSASAQAVTPPAKVPQITVDGYLSLVSKAKGKVVLVNIFASWCAPCRMEVPGLVKLREMFPESELVMIGISLDKAPGSDKGKTPKALTTFLEEMKIPYPIYLSAPGFEDALDITAVPQLLVYDKTGSLVINHTGLASLEDLTAVVKKLQAQ